MLQVVLVFESRVERFHARGHVLARVVVQVAQSDLVFTSGCLGLKKVEIDGVVVGERHELFVNTLVLHNLRQEF